jgi:hypothetical protein
MFIYCTSLRQNSLSTNAGDTVDSSVYGELVNREIIIIYLENLCYIHPSVQGARPNFDIN